MTNLSKTLINLSEVMTLFFTTNIEDDDDKKDDEFLVTYNAL